jgi:hypothetical protein
VGEDAAQPAARNTRSKETEKRNLILTRPPWRSRFEEVFVDILIILGNATGCYAVFGLENPLAISHNYRKC